MGQVAKSCNICISVVLLWEVSQVSRPVGPNQDHCGGLALIPYLPCVHVICHVTVKCPTQGKGPSLPLWHKDWPGLTFSGQWIVSRSDTIRIWKCICTLGYVLFHLCHCHEKNMLLGPKTDEKHLEQSHHSQVQPKYADLQLTHRYLKQNK